MPKHRRVSYKEYKKVITDLLRSGPVFYKVDKKHVRWQQANDPVHLIPDDVPSLVPLDKYVPEGPLPKLDKEIKQEEL